MAKRGRKKNVNRKGYFYEEQEQAVVDFINCNNDFEKDKIFNTILKPAFTKMIESIIRRYNLYPPDEDYQTIFDDTLSFLITKIEKFNVERGYKAYSYCGTICKNYLIYKINSFKKNQERNLQFENLSTPLSENEDYSYNPYHEEESLLKEIFKKTIKQVENILNDSELYKLKENEIKIGKCLITLFTNWEDIFATDGSNKFNKSSILLFLKENTLLTTKEIRDGLKKYKLAYFNMKKNILNDNY